MLLTTSRHSCAGLPRLARAQGPAGNGARGLDPGPGGCTGEVSLASLCLKSLDRTAHAEQVFNCTPNPACD